MSTSGQVILRRRIDPLIIPSAVDSSAAVVGNGIGESLARGMLHCNPVIMAYRCSRLLDPVLKGLQPAWPRSDARTIFNHAACLGLTSLLSGLLLELREQISCSGCSRTRQVGSNYRPV